MAIAEGIAATNAALKLATVISDLVNRPNIDPVEVRGKLHELLIHAVNAQSAIGEANVEIRELRQSLDNREELKTLAGDLEMNVHSLFLVRKSEKERGLIPYCPTCWGADSKLVPLALVKLPGSFTCPIHKVNYKSQDHIETEQHAAETASHRRRFHMGGSSTGWS